MHRTHVDEDSGALLVHVLDAGFRRQERAVEMDGEQLLPIRKRKILDRVHDLDTGIRNENIDLTEC